MDATTAMSTSSQRVRPLGLSAVVAIIFFEVSGGPFGIEDSVRYGGPRLALLGLLTLPILWSIPEALVTAELSTMFPEDSGFVAWITAAFGPFWGFQCGFLSWISGVIDNSIYPIFLVRYLKWFFPILEQTVPQKLFLVVSSVGMTYLNYRGLKVVGRTAMILTVFILLPFAVLAFIGIDSIEPSHWWSVNHASSQDLVSFINVMFWNLNYWDSVATLSGEIGDVGSVLPKALILAVFLVSIGYFVPILVGVGIVGGDDWPEGFFSYLGARVAGVWMEGWMVLSAVASQVGLFTAELSSDAYLILGLAESGMLPKRLGQKSRYGTPTLALLLSCSGVSVMLVSFDFVSAVEMLNAVYCLSELLEFAALIRLRVILPRYPRPFKIPLSVPGICCMLLPCSLFAVGIVVAPFFTRDFVTLSFTLTAVVTGIVVYHIFEQCRRRHWLHFHPMALFIATHTYQPLSETDTRSISLQQARPPCTNNALA